MSVECDSGGLFAFLLGAIIWLWWLFAIICIIGWIYDWLYPKPTDAERDLSNKNDRIARGIAKSKRHP